MTVPSRQLDHCDQRHISCYGGYETAGGCPCRHSELSRPDQRSLYAPAQTGASASGITCPTRQHVYTSLGSRVSRGTPCQDNPNGYTDSRGERERGQARHLSRLLWLPGEPSWEAERSWRLSHCFSIISLSSRRKKG